MKKTAVVNALNALPEEFSLDDFFERLLVIEKIDKGLDDLRENRITAHEKVKRSCVKWQKEK